jgi:hypothetical protein
MAPASDQPDQPARRAPRFSGYFPVLVPIARPELVPCTDHGSRGRMHWRGTGERVRGCRG